VAVQLFDAYGNQVPAASYVSHYKLHVIVNGDAVSKLYSSSAYINNNRPSN